MTSKNIQLSVIIPMYNCESTIKKCIGSIDSRNTEIIVVDDGSKDNGANIVEALSSSNPDIRLIRKENGGVSSARNRGLQEAVGQYVAFVDADDFMSSGGLDRVLSIALDADADVVKYRVRHIPKPEDNSFSVTDWEIHQETLEGKAAPLYRYDISDYHVVDGLFRRSLLMDNGIQFNTGLRIHEDDVFMGHVYSVASKVISTDLPLYNYIVASPCSATGNPDIEWQRSLIASSIKAIELRKSLLQSNCPDMSFPLERYKYMRWTCWPNKARDANYTLAEYRSILKEFKRVGTWPVRYRWVKVARLDKPLKSKIKHYVKTFLTNHPALGFAAYKYRKRMISGQ